MINQICTSVPSPSWISLFLLFPAALAAARLSSLCWTRASSAAFVALYAAEDIVLSEAAEAVGSRHCNVDAGGTPRAGTTGKGNGSASDGSRSNVLGQNARMKPGGKCNVLTDGTV